MGFCESGWAHLGATTAQRGQLRNEARLGACALADIASITQAVVQVKTKPARGAAYREAR